MQHQVGYVGWSPDYGGRRSSGGYVHQTTAALESGDNTLVRPRQGELPYVVVRPEPKLQPPAPANDNRVSERPRIVGLIGYAGSGKTTVANVLREQGYVLRKFAAPLKSMLVALYRTARLEEEQIQRRIEGGLKEVPDPLLNGRTPRQAMQWLGTEWGRGMFGDDFWVGMWAAGLADGQAYVTDDCRFANEVDAIRARGGIVVQVNRPGVGPVSGHQSENLPTAPDRIIDNTGSIDDLRDSVFWLAA